MSCSCSTFFKYQFFFFFRTFYHSPEVFPLCHGPSLIKMYLLASSVSLETCSKRCDITRKQRRDHGDSFERCDNLRSTEGVDARCFLLKAMPHPNVAAHRRLGSDGAGAVGSMPSTVTARHPRKPGALDDPLFWRPGVAGAGGSSTVAPGQCLVANTSGRVACSRRHSTVVAQNPRWSSVERSRGEAVDRCPRPFANLEGIKSLGGRSRESRDPSPSLTQRSHSWASLREPQAPHAVRHAASVVRPHSSSPKASCVHGKAHVECQGAQPSNACVAHRAQRREGACASSVRAV